MKCGASSSGINVENVDPIIHEPLFFKKMDPKDVMSNQRAQRVCVYAEHLHWFELEGNTFLEWIVTCDETEYTALIQSQSFLAWKLHKS